MWSVGGRVLKSMFVPNELEMSLAIRERMSSRQMDI